MRINLKNTSYDFSFKGKNQLPLFMITKEYYSSDRLEFAKILFQINGRECNKVMQSKETNIVKTNQMNKLNISASEIINLLAERCDESLSSLGYKDYMAENIGEALDVLRHGGTIYDLDNILHLKDIMLLNVSYEMYSYIDSQYEDSVLELGSEDRNELLQLLFNYTERKY